MFSLIDFKNQDNGEEKRIFCNIGHKQVLWAMEFISDDVVKIFSSHVIVDPTFSIYHLPFTTFLY